MLQQLLYAVFMHECHKTQTFLQQVGAAVWGTYVPIPKMDDYRIIRSCVIVYVI